MKDENLYKPQTNEAGSPLNTDKARLALPEIKQSFTEINLKILNGLGSSELSALNHAIGAIRSNINQNIFLL